MACYSRVLLQAFSVAALFGLAGPVHAQTFGDDFGTPPQLDIRRAPRPFLSGVLTPDEFWSNDYQSGELAKSLIAPDQMDETRYRRRRY